MAKRIFRNMVLMAAFAVLLTAAIIIPSLYTVHENSQIRELRQDAECIVSALALADDDVAFLQSLNASSRVTLIEPDGTVLYDNRADASGMENHIDRPEVMAALSGGSGESVRNSDTLSETTLYYAFRMDDGSVLRLANTRSSMLGTFLDILPLIGIMLIGLVAAALVVAKKTARRIVAPINALNLDQPLENDAYDELAPLLSRMHHQHLQIYDHVEALENARSELTAIMENMREGMILLDAHDCILSMNESAARIFDTHSETHIGQNLLSVSRDADLHALIRSAYRREGGDMLIRRNGRHYRLYASPVMQNSDVRGAVLLVLDVSERVAAEESRREFTANVSHELKTPLTAISGFAEIIRDGIAKPQDVPHFAGMICKESARLIALVNDILDLSQLDEKQNLGQKEVVLLTPMLQGLMDDFALSAQKKNLTLKLSGNETEIEGYPKLLREMFFNLIDNALKYTPEGGCVTVAVEKTEGSVICSIADTGIGIPKEHQEHVFERFYRVDKSHSKQTGGTGLGLAIVKHVAMIHKATIDMSSIVNEGTVFHIRFS